VGYRHWGHKLIYDLSAQTTELYDLKQDPGEKTDLYGASEDVSPQASVLEGRLKKALLSDAAASDLQQIADMKLEEKMDQETEKRLRALGYVQ
jgi:arylsulfatase A-like enzyme